MLCACGFSFAQTPAQPLNPEQQFRTIRYSGLKAGVNVSSFTAANSYTGFHAGLFTEIRFRKSLGYGAEIMFSNQGGYRYGSPVVQNYVILPVMFNLYTGKVAFQVGGYGGLLMSSFLVRDRKKYDVSGALAGTDLGGTVGIRWKVFKKIGLSARYYLGFKRLTEDYSYYYESGTHNRNFQGSLLYEF
jgi:hypothetical protein